MPRFEWLNRIKAIEREYAIVRLAVDLMTKTVVAGDADLPPTLDLADCRSAEAGLAATYLVRLFAEFEAALRDYWRNIRDKTSEPPVSVLMTSIRDHCAIPDAEFGEADGIRDRRNRIVHEGLLGQSLDIASARGALCAFLAKVHRDWPA